MKWHTEIKETNDAFIINSVLISDCLVDGIPKRNHIIKSETILEKKEYNINDVHNYIKGGETLMVRKKYFSDGCVTQLNRDGTIHDVTNDAKYRITNN